MIILNKWYGRLGNNIKQLSNIIDIALMYKHNIKFNVKNINFFDLTAIKKYFSKYNNTQIIQDNTFSFFYKNKLKFPLEIYELNIKERNEILKNALLIKNISKLNENDVVVHIRSGDIFSSKAHPAYVPPPLSYYVKEINKYKYEKIYIICEDTINPVINELLKIYKNAVYQKNSLEKDIRMILGATNIIFSVGSFIPALMLLSDNIKHVHDIASIENFKELEDYYKITKPWKNTQIQREYILSYV